MAHGYIPHMHASILGATEINYELGIRNLLKSTDNYNRRRMRLKQALANEVTDPKEYSVLYALDKEVSEIKESYANLNEIYSADKECTLVNIEYVETLLVHLRDRVERAMCPTTESELKPIRERLLIVYDEVVAFYNNLQTVPLNPNPQTQKVSHVSAPIASTPTLNTDQNLTSEQNELIKLIEQTFKRLMPQQSQPSGNPNTPNNRNETNHRLQDRLSESSSQDGNELEFEPVNQNNPSSTRLNYNNTTRSYRVNVLDWRFKFSGLDKSEDPKSMDVETFLQKVADYSEAEGFTESEMMKKIHQLLQDHAADWYSHARKKIHTWSDFKKALRSRFGYEESVDRIRQQIYSKKQKPGENTLHFIDQFVNLIHRLPSITTERQCLNYVLEGIRTDIARMARTAGVKSIDELIKYVKETFGRSDKQDSRFPFRPNNQFNSSMKNKESKMKVELMSEDEHEYSDDEYELNEVNRKEVPHPNRINRQFKYERNIERSDDRNTLFLKPNRKVPKTIQNEKVIETCVNPCPYCEGNHSYKECPLPPEKKQRHCFICKSTTHIASQCIAKENKAQPSSVQCEKSQTKDPAVSVNEMELVLPPQITFVESVIFFPMDDQRPYITAKTGNIELTGLVDTGSHATVIGQNLYEANEWEVELQPHDTTIITADGTMHKAKGILLLTYEVHGKRRVVPTLVLPIVMKKPIFGIDFQRHFGIGMVMFNTEVIDIDTPKQQKVYDNHTLSEEQQSLLTSVIETLPKVSEEGVLNCTSIIEHTIDTGNHKPVYSKPYIFSPNLQQKIRAEIERMIKRGIIKRVTESEWLNTVIPVPKSDGSIRLCINAKKLNLITKKNRNNTAHIERIFARLPKARYFSSIDLKDAYYQIPLAKQDQLKTAFMIHGLGLFAFDRMPQGLVNSAATLNEVVAVAFGDDLEPEIFVYVDDFIICSETFERHIELLQILSEKLKKIGMAIGLNKSKFCMKRLKFLGHEVNENGISIDSSRLQAIISYMKPTTAKEIRSFLGFTGWHRKFVKGYAELSAPLVNLARKNVKFEWKPEHQKAFEAIREALVKSNILCNPNYSLPFHIDSTSSSVGTSAVLYQMVDGNRHIIAYMSTKLNELQKKYHPVEKECFALIVALEKFRHYIEGNKIIVTTDQCSLNWLRNCTDPTGRLARWALRLHAYDFELKTKKFPQSEPISILSRETKAIEGPLIPITELCTCEIEGQVNTEVIDIVDISNTQDEWYKKNFEFASCNPENEYFKIVDGILYHRFDKLKRGFENEWKICVPSENRKDVFHEHHDSVLASHPGIYRTLRRIQNVYYWPKMMTQVHDYVNKCEICRTTKSSNVNTNTQMGHRRETDFPFRTLSVDFVGPMTMSKQRNQYLLVVIDNFTKYVCLKPMRTATAANVVRFLEEEVFLKYGVCEQLICDNGVQFASKELANLMKKYNSELRFTPFYFPQSNPCEIANKAIVNAIRSYVTQHDSQRIWDAELPAILCALNCHVHTSTNMTPYFALHGHNMILNGKDYAKIIDVNDECEENMNDKLSAIRHMVREHLFKAYVNIERTVNKRAGTRMIDMNKDTYLKNTKLSNAGERYSKKLGDKYIPVRISKQVGENTYLISDKNGKLLGKYHASMLMQRDNKNTE